MTTQMPPPHLVASPGDILEEWLEERGMTQRELADRLGKSEKFVSQLINGKASLTPDTAQVLELVTRVSAPTWLRIEGQHQAARKRVELIAAAAESPIEATLVKALRALGVVTAPPGERGAQTVQVWELLGVGSHQGLMKLSQRHAAAFRTSTAFTPDVVAIEVLIALARREAEGIDVAPLNAGALRRALPTLRALTVEGAVDGSAQARSMLAPLGVALVFLPSIPKAHCNGLTLWSRDHAVVAITDRGRREDTFWFTLFHELSHVLDGDREAIYLESQPGGVGRLEAEERADTFATELLIPADHEHLLYGINTFADLLAAAQTLHLSPGVLVGQLHHRGLKHFSWGQGHIQRIQTSHSEEPLEH